MDILEIGVLESVGDNSHSEGIALGIAYRERHAIDCHAALVNSEISLVSHLGVNTIFKGEILAAVGVLDGCALGCAVNVSLNDMPVEAAVHHHRALHVHLVARLQHTEITAIERLFHRGHCIYSVFNLHHSQAHAVVSHALVNLQLVGKRAAQ